MGLTATPALRRHVAVPHPVRRWHQSDRTERTVAISAAGFIVLLVAGMVALAIDGVTGSPAADASNQEIADFFADHRFAHLVNMHLASVAILVLLPLFALGLSRVLRRAERHDADHLASSVVLVAGVVAVLAAFVQAVAWSAAAYGVEDQSANVVRGLYDLGNVGFVLMAYPMGLLMVAASISAHRAGIIATAPARAGIALGVLVSLSAIPFSTVMAGFGLFVVWSLLVSWSLLGRSSTPGST